MEMLHYIFDSESNDNYNNKHTIVIYIFWIRITAPLLNAENRDIDIKAFHAFDIIYKKIQHFNISQQIFQALDSCRFQYIICFV